DEDEGEAESSDRGTIEVRVDVVAKIDIQDASLETISAIENALGKVRDCQHGLYTAGGVSRVEEMILARERDGFAGKKYGATYKLFLGLLGGKEDFLGSRQKWSP
ncbi:hypothetical protein Tco_0981691, partial [Tanacetum coccineum]